MAPVIVVGVDSGETSRRAVAFARDRAKDLGADAELVLAHVIPWSPYSFTTPEENEVRHRRRQEELTAAREQVLAPAAAIVGDAIPVTTVARHGDRAELLCSLAREHDATHILVGRNGESRLRQTVFGSVPSQLIQMADVPVTVVP